jgi:Uma2 family endonuclease
MCEESEEMSSALALGEQRVFLGEVSWRTFQSLLDDLGSPRGRLAYDEGLLEIMSPSFEHETIKTLLGRLIVALTEELDIPIRSTSSTTLKRRARQKAVEADESYYIANEPSVRHRRELDLRRQPPPDLVVEVDLSSSSLIRMPVYAALGVPEVWRWIGSELELLRLDAEGQYVATKTSVSFPMLTVEVLMRFLGKRHDTDETSIVRSFRAWVRSGSHS